jgi:hypothetical protein
MVKVPGNLFLASLTCGKVYWFSTNPSSGIPNHYHICVAKTDDDIVVFVCCTSQEKTMNKLIEMKGLSPSTIVYIKEGNYNFTKDTFINCNEVYTMTIKQFSEHYNKGEVEFKSEIGANHYKQIVDGIKESRLVAIEHKKMIPDIE